MLRNRPAARLHSRHPTGMPLPRPEQVRPAVPATVGRFPLAVAVAVGAFALTRTRTRAPGMPAWERRRADRAAHTAGAPRGDAKGQRRAAGKDAPSLQPMISGRGARCPAKFNMADQHPHKRRAVPCAHPGWRAGRALEACAACLTRVSCRLRCSRSVAMCADVDASGAECGVRRRV